jgi:hypothetical protein
VKTALAATEEYEEESIEARLLLSLLPKKLKNPVELSVTTVEQSTLRRGEFNCDPS